MGDEGKAVGSVLPTALLSLKQHFCADRHFAMSRIAVTQLTRP
jgi:hypothetical protein